MASVLLVEDAPLVLQVTEKMVSREGHVVTTATTAQEALTILASEEPDLLITDLRLPDGNGEDLARAALERRPALAVLITTGDPQRGGTELMWKLADLGIRGILNKPYSQQELRDALKRALAPPDKG
jgi:CheY-like chemotaxis protein